jgi:hypothetical protein
MKKEEEKAKQDLEEKTGYYTPASSYFYHRGYAACGNEESGQKQHSTGDPLPPAVCAHNMLKL